MTSLRDLVNSQGGLCHYCQRRMEGRGGLEPTKEHLIPRSRKGSNARINLKAACRRCNELKDSLTEDEFRKLYDMDNLPPFPGKERPGGGQHQPRRQIDFVGHDVVSGALRSRAGYRPADVGLSGAATATIGEILAAKLQK